MVLPPRHAAVVSYDQKRLNRFPSTAAYLLPDSKPVKAGDTLHNPAYAASLRTLGGQGAKAFYTGAIAQGIVDTVQKAPGNPGVLSLGDLRHYAVKERVAVCAPYRSYEVCGMGPPSSGALTVGQILGLLTPYDLGALGVTAAESWRLIGDASRLAFADRSRYMADSEFVPMPTKGLTDPAYLASRSALLEGDTALKEVTAGDPPFDHALNWSPDDSIELPSTSHISIVDRYGNALSMATTIENAFGSRLITPGGYFLNNELTDFSFRTHRDGVPIANRLDGPNHCFERRKTGSGAGLSRRQPNYRLCCQNNNRPPRLEPQHPSGGRFTTPDQPVWHL